MFRNWPHQRPSPDGDLLFRRHPPTGGGQLAFPFSQSGEAVTEEVDRPKQEIAVRLKAAKAVFYAGAALDLGYQEAKRLNIRGPI
jgi:hypothetical protein